MTIPITWVDAFSDKAFGGNPAAVCLVREPLDDERMQSIAFELGIAETAYLTPTEDPTTFGLRWFSPAVEIDLCGHATLASAHALREGGVVDGTASLTFHTRSGPLRAAFDGDTIELDFPADPVTPAPLPAPLEGQWPGAVVASGRTEFFTFVALSSAEAVRAYEPDLPAIASTGAKALLLTAAAAPGSGADYVLRVFGPNVGIDEDPATGSAQCSAGPYWAAELGRDDLVAHQLSRRGATLYVRPGKERVRDRGACHHGADRRAVLGIPTMVSSTTGTSTEDLRALVEGHEPASPREVAARERFLSELGQLAAPCDEHAGPTHVTASGIVVGRRGTVLHRHKKLGIWMQPGGHIDPGEGPDEAALREATEELGLAVAHPAAGPLLIHLDVHEAAHAHTHLDLRYLLLGADADPMPPPDESPDARWCSWDEALQMADPALIDALPLARAAYEDLGMTDDLAHLLAVQDLDTSITQLEHRRAALVESSGLAAVEAAAGLARGRAGRRHGAPRRADRHAEGPRGADRRHQRAPRRHREAHVRRHRAPRAAICRP